MPAVNPSIKFERRLEVGAECQPGGGVHFRVWAPQRRRVYVVGEDGHDSVLEREEQGYHSRFIAGAGQGWRYRFRLDDERQLYPDPASRFQPEGVHGPSEVVDPSRFPWTDGSWRGPTLLGQVIYELHVGTFTREGTYRAAIERLPHLADVGVTVVELLPLADFGGQFGWGYDGVDLFAPTRLYGTPDDLRALVDRAHQLGLSVILDVVYNHLGPDGCYLRPFSAAYFTERHRNEWGEGLNFDGEQSGPVREFYASNAAYWIDEFHFDGLRLDATHAIVDDSPEHILAVISRRVRTAARGRRTLLVSENEPQDTIQLTPVDQGGHGIDMAWNDDFHHAAIVAATGNNEGYYGDYRGSPQELISAVRWGYLYQGQWHSRQGKTRGTPAYQVSAPQFVTFLDNHDQTANSAQALRIDRLTSPGRYRAITALFLLAPGTPMLFQGQEFAASSPFHYFADHEPGLAKLVRKGRVEFLQQFRSLAHRPLEDFADPADRRTFEISKLDWTKLEQRPEVVALHRDLLTLRREDPVFAQQRADRVEGAVLDHEAFVLRFFGENGDDRLLFVNLGPGRRGYSLAEPLLAPPVGRDWQRCWSSQDARYGGPGSPPLDLRDDWHLPAHAAIVLRATQS